MVLFAQKVWIFQIFLENSAMCTFSSYLQLPSFKDSVCLTTCNNHQSLTVQKGR